MGARGPAPTPKSILALRGSWRADAHGCAPNLPPDAPTPPDWLCPDAVAVWGLVVPQLAGAGVLSSVDWSCVAQFCATWVHWRDAVKSVDADGVLVERTTQYGTQMEANPAVRVAASLSVELRQLGDRLGLSPSARARLKAPDAPTVPPLEGRPPMAAAGGES